MVIEPSLTARATTCSQVLSSALPVEPSAYIASCNIAPTFTMVTASRALDPVAL